MTDKVNDTSILSDSAGFGGNAPRVIAGGGGLAVTRIGKSFNKRPVVRSVSLALRRGEAVGLLGPNGAGKTTTFYMITGLIAADTGSIAVDGHDITRLPMYRRARLGIGYLPQEASIPTWRCCRWSRGAAASSRWSRCCWSWPRSAPTSSAATASSSTRR